VVKKRLGGYAALCYQCIKENVEPVTKAEVKKMIEKAIKKHENA